jgi:SAM-dependent methyltransferase
LFTFTQSISRKFTVNKIKLELEALGLINENSIREFYPRVRDRDDVKVLKDDQSGIIFLSDTSQVERNYYSAMPGTSYWSSENRTEGLKVTSSDDKRRFHQFGEMAREKDFLDVGCGLGGSLELFKQTASSVSGVELQNEIRKTIIEAGHIAYDSVFMIPEEKKFNLITLFHVFEHLVEPLETLKKLYHHLAPGGKLIIEVPHANDALIKSFNLDSFKAFTFWSEHLILHTRHSLATFLKAAGFNAIEVDGFQRYPFANHLYWLKEGKPGGQEILKQFKNEELENAYARHLNAIDETDTLIAIATRD